MYRQNLGENIHDNLRYMFFILHTSYILTGLQKSKEILIVPAFLIVHGVCMHSVCVFVCVCVCTCVCVCVCVCACVVSIK